MNKGVIGKRNFDSHVLRARHKLVRVATVATMIGAQMGLMACGKSNSSFAILPSGQSFQQAQATVNNKIDILWVVDNSGSMDPLQQNLVNNFSAFMSNFQTKGFDFQMAVTTADAYLQGRTYNNDATLAKFKDGAGTQHTGVYVINNQTPNALQTFVTNATQGSNGSGDERVFQSLLDTLSSPLNSGFPRPGAFFAVVILSDEDDFSNYNRLEGAGPDHDYTNPGLMTVDSLIASLDTLTSSTATRRNYNVSAITVMDSTCKSQHAVAAPSTTIGTRYMDLAQKTNGILGSVCDPSYASVLNFIQQRIVELTTQFKLDREPNVSTIEVRVNGALVPQSATNGWSYDSTANAISFHGTGVPPVGASVQITFDPASLL